MSAKPATIYLGTRSHFRRRLNTGHQGRARPRQLAADHQPLAFLKRKSSTNNQQGKKSGSSTSANKAKMAASVLHFGGGPDLGLKPPGHPTSSSNSDTANTTSSSSSSATKNFVKPGLPSPSTSSETSDYQRSTPSPMNDQFSRALESSTEFGWSQEIPTNDLICNDVEGSKPSRRKSTSSLVCNSKISTSNAVVLQQLRVALKKLPDAKLTSVLAASEAMKRRHSDSGLNQNNGLSKKAKMLCIEQQQPRRPLVASTTGLKGQGKITEYLPEMKHFIAMRKEKLDRVLNLHPLDLAASVAPASPKVANNDFVDISAASSCSSTPKKSICGNSESGVETGSNNDTASVASSGSRSSSGIGSNTEEIFEVPRTIRFPPAAPTKIYSEVVICKWELCGTEFDSTGKLLDHLKTIHAVADNQKDETESNANGGSEDCTHYKCLWEGCKVYGKGSSSKLWLEKHVLGHGGNKPFQCIVDGCKHRFGTQSLLERHVNNHFKNKETSVASNTSASTESGSGSGSRSSCSSASRSSAINQSTGSCSKVFRKLTGKRIKFRKTPFSARIFDLFDVASMAQVRMRLSEYESKCQEWKSSGFLENPHMDPDQVVILHSKIVARKTDPDGNLQILQSWVPPNILEDQWILAKDAVPTQSVKLSSLPLKAKVQLSSYLYKYPSTTHHHQHQPRRGRKLRPHPRSTALS